MGREFIEKQFRSEVEMLKFIQDPKRVAKVREKYPSDKYVSRMDFDKRQLIITEK
jgi:hypothetical protein